MKIISSLLLIVFFYTNGFAVEQKKITDDEQWSKKVETLNWKNLEQKEHSKEIKKANASILILEEEIYLDNFKDINIAELVSGSTNAGRLTIVPPIK